MEPLPCAPAGGVGLHRRGGRHGSFLAAPARSRGRKGEVFRGLNAEGQGVAIFSPSAKGPWNFGQHGTGNSTDPGAGPCMHVAPLETVALAPRATYRYVYWLAAGTEDQLARRLDVLWLKYSNQRTELVTH